ncbi:hypothetical protein [Bergeyella sp. RCAD1439]|uniref:hypothetical protein n=1 Tax=Bergeyella anatis TaxID=3113737 RepID=UPI002E16FB9F|nr:hypothetical protein [Bergeyella sp. RCAD1439]
MDKKNQNSKFQELVKKMDALKETEQGKLRGGISVVGTDSLIVDPATNYAICSCTVNTPCSKK